MAALQDQLVALFASATMVASIMRTRWGWPTIESVHFIGLSLLIGTIGLFDLRLLGMAKRVPIAALHRLIPWGIFGYAINVITGSMFLLTEPDQYVYNPAFHLKMLFMGVAGVNVLTFYFFVFRKVQALEPGLEAPRSARLIAGVSLFCWITVIVCGRLLTFYRPGLCEGPRGFLSTCIPGGGG
jgi:uncharacterized membrane protein